MRIPIIFVLLVAAVGARAAAATGNPDRMLFPNSIKAVPELQAGEQPARRAVIVRRTLRADELSENMDFEVALRMRNFPELQARIARGEVISQLEMAARYWPLEADQDRVLAWFNSRGLAVVRTDLDRLAVFGHASVAQVQQSFQTSFARVACRGGEFTSAVTAPSLPADVASSVAGIHGLQPHIRLHPVFRIMPRASGAIAPPYLPSQIAAAYGASGLNLNGSGQTIAIIENAYPSSSDLSKFWTVASTPSIPLVETVSIDGGPAAEADSGSLEEATLDIEWAGGLAPGATIRVYGSNVSDGAGFDKTYQQVYTDAAGIPGMNQFSISFGTNEDELDQDYLLIESQYFANLASAGIAVLVASGDGGSNPDPNTGEYDPADPLTVGYPTSDPDVTGVGGTTLMLSSNGSISSETAWSVNGNGTNGTSGGPSAYFARPAWQSGAGVTPGSFRLTPDVAGPANPSYGATIIFSGQEESIGGTSWATPTWAAFCAMINQSRASNGQAPLGFLNPKIYTLIGTSAFHDITVGNNGAYSATVGYDLCTGIGTPNFAALLQTSFSSAATAPVVVAQLGNQAVTPGQIATFGVAAQGTAPLTYQWQRMPWGSENWYNLTDNGTYTGSAASDLAVSGATYAMDGDEFRCVVSNAPGSAASPSAELIVGPVGVTTLAGWPDAFGSENGTGRFARFNAPGSVRVDSNGNAYVADSGNNTIRKITPQGVVTTVAGVAGVAGSTNGPASTALFNAPSGVAIDLSGNLYVSDNGNYEIREISSSGVVSTLAGSAGQPGTSDGTGTGALFYDPQNLAIDGYGNLYVVDGAANTVRRVVIATGAVATIAGSPRKTGSANGMGSSARFNDPVGVGTDSSGNVYVADSGNNTIRMMTPAGVVTTLAGLAGSAGSADGTGASARFNFPSGVAVDSTDNIFVADSGNDTIREISPALAVSTIAGAAGQGENIDGLALNARFYAPGDIALDSADNLYIADTGNNTVRRFVQGSLSAPTGSVTVPPPSPPITAGSSTSMAVNVPTAGAGATLQWELNGVAIPGATSSIYSIPIAGTADAGVYSAVASNEAGSTTLSAGTLQVTANANLFNISSRAYLGTGPYQNIVAGFYTNGSGAKNIVVRGVGPGLVSVDPALSGLTIANPKLTLFNGSQTVLATNTAWGGSQALINDFASVYAFPLQANSNDTAIFTSVPASSGVGYTAEVDGLNGGTGIALAEIYDYDAYTGTPASNLINISTRAFVGAGNDVLVAGFWIIGSTPQTVLIRAVGPGLTAGNPALSGLTVATPVLTLFDSSGKVIASNVGWGNAPVPGNSSAVAGIESATAAIMSEVYATPLAAGSADCAMVVTLPPNAGYTAQVSGGGATGVALVEVYIIP